MTLEIRMGELIAWHQRPMFRTPRPHRVAPAFSQEQEERRVKAEAIDGGGLKQDDKEPFVRGKCGLRVLEPLEWALRSCTLADTTESASTWRCARLASPPQCRSTWVCM
mmetsp:Transcript_13881/g.37777  ORF Transcript_13881/g.37777 Transcript_13881/m.37777 type:complete len:109 (+) Transcript_13881:571-897(+)